MVLFVDAVRSIRAGKSMNIFPTERSVAGALRGDSIEAMGIKRAKSCKEIMAELHRKPLTFYLLNGRPILCNLENRIKLK